jgi:hypothetical protein
MYNRLNSLLEQFNKKSKDYIFLVNEDFTKDNRVINQTEKIEYKIKKSLELIFDNYIEHTDRLSLMTYGKNTKKMFSLVGIEKNKTQLRN